MKKALLTIFFLVFAYPYALIYQAIVGGFVGFFVALLLGTDAGARSTGLLAGLGFIVAGLLVYLTCRPKKSLNDKASMLLALIIAGSLLAGCHTAQTKQPSPVLFKGPRLVTDSTGWTYPEHAKPTADVLATL